MRFLKVVASVLLTVAILALTGFGGSNSGATASDPFAPHVGTTVNNETVFGNVSTATGKTGISLVTDVAKVDVNNGQVLATAKLVSSGGALSGVPVTFSIEAPVNGPAAIEAGMSTVATNSNGEAVTRITTGNMFITSNVIVKAAAKIGTQTFATHATFQIVRGGGVIMFTDLAGLQPGGQRNIYAEVVKEVDVSYLPPAPPAQYITFVQLLPFKLTDSNGNPRVGVPVTISVYSITTLNASDAIVDFLVAPVTESSQNTITTDSAGQGIFNSTIDVKVYPAGTTDAVAVVFKAVTNDAIPLTAYVGNTYTLVSKPPKDPAQPKAVVLTPASATFGTDNEISLFVSGGTKPYTVVSNKPNRVEVALKPDGTTIAATLLDKTAWTDEVTIVVTDAAGQVASAILKR
jgi:hypothetical protein